MFPTRREHHSNYPHHTEDILVSAIDIQLVDAGPIDWLAAGAPPTYASVDQAFGGRLDYSRIWLEARQGVHVPENTRIASLSAVTLPVQELTLFEDNWQGKRRLRAFLDDGQARYNLPVAAKDLREAYRSNGVRAARELLPGRGDVHIRLGLARAKPDFAGKCYLMINGVYG